MRRKSWLGYTMMEEVEPLALFFGIDIEENGSGLNVQMPRRHRL